MSREPAPIRTADEIARIGEATRVVHVVLGELRALAVPGATTGALDRHAERRLAELGATPAFKGYHGFPACVCVSVNDEVVHGIPSDGRVLAEGDLLSLDFGAVKDGWFGDAAITVPVGRAAPEALRLAEVTREALLRGVAAARPGARLGDVGAAVQRHVEAAGYSVVRDFVGHGIGRKLHEPPAIPNSGTPGTGLPLREGMVLAIEPMVNAGGADIEVLDDGWTAVTRDRSLSAHFEHTVAITAAGPRILGQGGEGRAPENT